MRFKFVFVFVFFSSLLFAQKERKVVLWDVTELNQETNASRFHSVNRMLRSAGIPYDTTSSADTAILYPIIITGSRFQDDAVNPSLQLQLENYVSNGGILITSSMRDTALFNLCGISGFLSDDDMYFIHWEKTGNEDYFSLVNDSLELTVSLGDSLGGPAFYTRAYYLTTAQTLGHYENGLAALTVNNFGNGKVYTFGPDFRDIYLRNQLDYDLNAHRTYSNGFEPTSDVFMFIVRNIIRKHISNSVYKYTSPGTSKNVVMITHDIDSYSGVDTMWNFSLLEKQRSISAQYNVTTRYFNDAWMTSFYVGSQSEVDQLKQDGHVLSSHSVGHFPEFDNETIFPYGSLGNTPQNYQPNYSSGITTDGTVLGELEVSKNLIEGDHSVNVRSFRAGHLAFHDSLVTGLELLNYEFNSTHSSNNVLTAFPYYEFKVRSFSSIESSVLEIPMTISDVFNSDPINSGNYMQKVQVWVDATRKYAENNAPVVLLIHPNRMYKLTAQQAYLDSLDNDILLINMEDYGDYWRKRDSLQFHTTMSSDTLFVYFENNSFIANQSFVIDTVGISTVRFFDYTSQELAFSHKNYDLTQQLYYFDQGTSITEEEIIDFQIYPNPAKDEIWIHYPSDWNRAELIMTNIMGEIVLKKNLIGNGLGTIKWSNSVSSGLYFITIMHQNQPYTKKLMIH